MKVRAVNLVVFALLSVTAIAGAQELAPPAPDSPPRFSAYAVNWQRFQRLAGVAKDTTPADRLTEVARALRSNVPAEAGRLSSLDLYCLGNAWFAYHYPARDPANKGKTILPDASALDGEELYALGRKGYKITAEQSVRIDARLLSMLGIPSESMTGLVRGAGIDRGAWVLSQVGSTWMRTDIAACLPGANDTDWHPPAAYFQFSSDIEGVLSFLKAHLPDGELTARQQGLKSPLSLSDWEEWANSESRIRSAAQVNAEAVLYSSKAGLFTPNAIGDDPTLDRTIEPPTAGAISALEQLRRKPYKPTRGEYLAATARKYVGLPYVWGGQNPDNGFDCSGLMQYVCRTWGIAIPRTAAEQYHVGRPVSFMELEPGDLVFLANTYKPGVSHVGMYIGEGLWVQAQGAATGIVEGDVPYFDAGTGPGARRLNLTHLPRVDGEPIRDPVSSRAAVIASRHLATPRPTPARTAYGGIVSIRVCGDTGHIANSGCDTYKLMRMPKSQAKTMRHCHKHKPLGGERW